MKSNQNLSGPAAFILNQLLNEFEQRGLGIGELRSSYEGLSTRELKFRSLGL